MHADRRNPTTRRVPWVVVWVVLLIGATAGSLLAGLRLERGGELSVPAEYSSTPLVLFFPKGDRFVAVESDGRVRVWDTASARVLSETSGETPDPGSPTACAWLQPGAGLVVGYSSGSLSTLRLTDRDRRWQPLFPQAGPSPQRASRFDTEQSVQTLTVQKDKIEWIAGGKRYRWDCSTGARSELGPGTASRPAPNQDSPQLLAVWEKGGDRREIWETDRASLEIRLKGRLTTRVMGPPERVLTVAPDGRRAAVAYEDGSVRAWELRDGGRTLGVFVPASPPERIWCDPAGRRVYALDTRGATCYWDPEGAEGVPTPVRDGEPIAPDPAMNLADRSRLSAMWGYPVLDVPEFWATSVAKPRSLPDWLRQRHPLVGITQDRSRLIYGWVLPAFPLWQAWGVLLLLGLGPAVQAVRQRSQRTRSRQRLLDRARDVLVAAGGQVRLFGERAEVTFPGGPLARPGVWPVAAVVSPGEEEIRALADLARGRGDSRQQVGLLLSEEPPNLVGRLEIAQVRAEHRVVVVPLLFSALEARKDDPAECRGLLESCAVPYLTADNFFLQTGSIADPAQFFGRADLLTQLEADLTRGQPVGLFGLRKSGKTSLLWQLEYRVRNHIVLRRELIDSGDWGIALFRWVLETLQKQTTLPDDPADPLRFPTSFRSAAEGAEAFREEFTRLCVRGPATGKELPVLLLLDELDRVFPWPGASEQKYEEFNAVFSTLRALHQELRSPVLLVCDLMPDCNAVNLWDRSEYGTNPLFQYFTERYVRPFDQSETLEMLNGLGALLGHEFADPTARQIQAWSGGHPYLSRRLAATTIGASVRRIEPEALPPLSRIFDAAGALDEYLHGQLEQYLEGRGANTELRVLHALAAAEEGLTAPDIQERNSVAPVDLRRTLRWLTHTGLIDTVPGVAEPTYRLRLQLYAEFYRQSQPMIEVVPSTNDRPCN